ncbi:molecular chaperone [Marinomonas sp. 15G1-11]|uniref:Molecular chaperone n=1 Tax=Marinomonas phaeophyticola TaxID=3004091 RepID=A0ABT4JRM7_9GAMM|nr:molecular chaperone [Marinomonas sp. 15G1-11]MCZ2721014.1 molecular chaperone [Marinomonas sp. 15G1-11]
MITGLDYGTSNCALSARQQNATGDTRIALVPLENGKHFLPSTLYALERELIVESVAQNIQNKDAQQDFITSRRNQLTQANRVRVTHDIAASEQALFFGKEAFSHYLEQPDEGYFVKSPKSFLGSSGFRPQFIEFFEDIVTAMMQNIKHKAEMHLGASLTHTVIGRPVNFQGIHSEKSNTQALSILTTAAKRAGYQEVEFLYEPIAAGFAFEEQLTQDKTVLVIDIGGGTSDCAMVRMGPSYRDKIDRSEDFLSHTGERVGGNDLDIQLAGKNFMPLFGMESELKNGLPMPTQIFWDAVTTNDVSAQTTFNSLPTEMSLEQMLRDTKEPKLLNRLLLLRDNKQNFQLVRDAEQCKIALSDTLVNQVDLNYIEKGLYCDVSREAYTKAIQPPLSKMIKLMTQAVNEAGETPEVVFVTGGSAQSPIIRDAIRKSLGNVEILDGDHFGSVAAGLGVWAERIFA